MKKLSIIFGGLLLAIGGAAGFLVSTLVYKKKYQKKADEEIESVKKVYAKHFGAKLEGEDKPKHEESPEKPFMSKTSLDAAEPSSVKKYIDYAGTYKSADPVVHDSKPSEPAVKKAAPISNAKAAKPKKIVILTPEEFRESSNPTSTLFYYRDGVLADDDYNIIKRPEEKIGPEALKTFGRYEDDAVYVRNEDEGVDYEILLDNRNYIDVSPHGSGAPSDD